ncbi:hypothetical protein HNP99_002819 [Flavobacterium sp. 28A]|uniref:hypothetical protein n=1 Tax=Flavobacterium sp. 28A TaxID=2735895 RepID=UPI00156D8010|nr:hypothetical protein [Flavobacterium sp. 28A]NRT16452.1 hypothetical protein [Flavobacterium sp. 28A]
MKKIVITVLVVLVNFGVFAQKLKVDKGEIKLDEKTIGFIEGKKPVFKIFSLDKTYAITAELKSKPVNPNATVMALPWIVLTNDATGKSNEIEFKSRKFSGFNYDRSVAYELLDRNYLTIDGLNIEELERFINSEPTGISVKYLGEQQNIDNTNKIADSYQLTIDDYGNIYSVKAQNQDPKDKKIAVIKMTSPAKNGELMYEVLDVDNYLIATWYAKAAMVSGYDKFLNQEMMTLDKKVFKAAFDNRGNPTGYKMSKDITAMNIVRVLVGSGYTLGHHKNN